MKNIHTTILLTAMGTASLLLIACSPKSTTNESLVQDDPLQGFWMKSAPTETILVSEAFHAKPGDQVNIEGVIGGVLHPFSDAFSVMVIADDQLVFCNEMGDDEHCTTPWDACCENPDVLKISRATVQFISEEGIPFQQSLKGFQDLKELDLVIVKGIIDSNSTPENLIINASGLLKKSEII